MEKRTRVFAVALTAIIVWLCIKPRRLSAEMFTVDEVNELTQAVTRAQKEEVWTNDHAEVFETYNRVNGMPPTDLVLKHYLYIRSANGLNRYGLEKRMKSDMPSEME
jgi:hypothetical protein